MSTQKKSLSETVLLSPQNLRKKMFAVLCSKKYGRENMTAESSAKDNMVLFNASITDDKVWSQNGSLTFKVRQTGLQIGVCFDIQKIIFLVL